jgi:hypothetical protein
MTQIKQINADKNTKHKDAMLRVFGDKGKGTSTVRHCGLDPQSPFVSEDSDLCQNDDYKYKDGRVKETNINHYFSPYSSLNPVNPDSDSARMAQIQRIFTDNKICAYLFKSMLSMYLFEIANKRNQ